MEETFTTCNMDEAIEEVLRTELDNLGDEAPSRSMVREAMKQTLQGYIEQVLANPVEYFFYSDRLGSDYGKIMQSLKRTAPTTSTECPDCQGEGRAEIMTGLTQEGDQTFRFETCERCRGNGEIETYTDYPIAEMDARLAEMKF
jgi:hypothetical protein